ncbi:MAG: hypothetical protein MJA31_18000 [Clostridia bacterium]|nr:hypothetical protein [Clostridia bacterium]
MKYRVGLILTIMIITLLFAAFVFHKDVTLDYYIITGESDHWKALMEVSSYEAWWKSKGGRREVDTNRSCKYLVVYKGKNTKDIGYLEYKVEIEGSAQSHSCPLPESGIMSGHMNGSYFSVQEKTAAVTVKWDGKIESFELVEGGIK